MLPTNPEMTASSTGTTATTAQASELWTGCIATANQTQSTPTGGFTLLDGAVYSAVGCAYLYKIVSSTGTANTGTTLAAADGWVGCIATFKASTGGGGSDLTVTGNLTVNGTTTLQSDLDVQGNSKIHFSPGTSAPDTLLWRTNPNELSITNDAGSAYGNLQAGTVNLNGSGYLMVEDTRIARTNLNEISIQNNNGTSSADLKLNNLTASGNATVTGSANLQSGVLIPNNDSLINTQTQPVTLELPTFYVQPKQAYTNLGNGNVLFQDTTPLPPGITEAQRYPAGRYSSLYMVMTEDTKPGYQGQYNPIIATDHGLWVEKDIQTYGALFCTSDPGKGSGGGAILLGHGFSNNNDPPNIILTDSSTGYDTLYLKKFDGNPASLNVGSITHKFKVGPGGVSTNDLVAIGSDNTVVKGLFGTNETTVIGIATQTMSQYDNNNNQQYVPVVVWGIATAVADTTINAGDRICVSNLMPGRALAFNWHTHQLNIPNVPFNGSTGQLNSGIVIGKALTSAAQNGTFTMLVSISG